VIPFAGFTISHTILLDPFFDNVPFLKISLLDIPETTCIPSYGFSSFNHLEMLLVHLNSNYKGSKFPDKSGFNGYLLNH
jgi:hypothetical protein